MKLSFQDVFNDSVTYIPLSGMTVFSANLSAQPHLLHETKYLFVVHPDIMILKHEQLNLTIAIDAFVTLKSGTY